MPSLSLLQQHFLSGVFIKHVKHSGRLYRTL